MSRTQRFLGGVSVGCISMVLTMVVGLWLTPFLLGQIGTRDYGLWLITTQILGYLMLVVSRRALNSTAYVQRVPLVIRFVVIFMVELIKSNLRVAWEVLSPGWNMSPAIVAIPLTVTTPFQITLLAQLKDEAGE